MSLARAALLARPRPATLLIHQTRQSSSDTHAHHDDHHHDAYEDHTEYPKEEFISRFWLRTAAIAVLGYTYYKYAPSPSSDSYITRWLAGTTPAKDYWLAKDAEHTAGSFALSQEHMLFSDAKTRPVHRYRYPQVFDQISPHNRKVGDHIDTRMLASPCKGHMGNSRSNIGTGIFKNVVTAVPTSVHILVH